MSIHSIREVVKTLLKDSKLDGFYSNPNLQGTDATWLFQNGVGRRLVKEFTIMPLQTITFFERVLRFSLCSFKSINFSSVTFLNFVILLTVLLAATPFFFEYLPLHSTYNTIQPFNNNTE